MAIEAVWGVASSCRWAVGVAFGVISLYHALGRGQDMERGRGEQDEELVNLPNMFQLELVFRMRRSMRVLQEALELRLGSLRLWDAMFLA